MKALFAGVLFGSLAAGSAFAADMPVKAPPPAPVWSWTGFYVGGDVGGFLSQESAATNGYPTGFGAPAIVGAGFAGIGILPTAHGLDKSGVLGGLYAGYNWQSGKVLFGLEGDVNWLSRGASDAKTTFDTFGATRPDGTMVISTNNNNWLASARGRLGWVAGQWMLYATAGVAFTDRSASATWTPIPGALGPPPSASTVGFGGTKVGVAAGAGAEWMVSQNWLVRAEYLYYGFDGSSGVLPFVVPAGNGCFPAGTCGWNVSTSRLDIHTARLGVSYKFGGPVVAKY